MGMNLSSFSIFFFLFKIILDGLFMVYRANIWKLGKQLREYIG